MEKQQPDPSRLCIINEASQKRDTLGDFLNNKGYQVTTLEPGCFSNGQIQELLQQDPDCYILGEEVPLQKNAYNVVLLNDPQGHKTTSRLSTRISRTFDDGADFVASEGIKPIVLEAHIASILRRPREEHKSHRIHNLLIQDGNVIGYGNNTYFTERESELITALFNANGASVSTTKLILSVFETTMPSDITNIKILISRIRKKVGDNPKKPKLIKSNRSLGYRLDLESSQD